MQDTQCSVADLGTLDAKRNYVEKARRLTKQSDGSVSHAVHLCCGLRTTVVVSDSSPNLFSNKTPTFEKPQSVIQFKVSMEI